MTDEKLVQKIKRRCAILRGIIDHALGSATEVDAAHDELRILEWALIGAGVESPEIPR